MNYSLSKNKRGLIGSSIVMFVSIIAIVLILIIFVLGAAIVKKLDDVGGGVRIYDEKEVEIYNIFEYMEEYTALLNVKFFMEKGLSLDKSFSEVSYEK